MNTARVRNTLAYLYRIVEAGERGYAVVAANVSNRALKILYRSYAQQRLQFKEEILAELQRLGIHTKPRSNFLGLLHRGRIDIFAAFTIGDENRERMIHREVLLGESVAINAYEKTLREDLPAETREIVNRQFDEVRRIVEQARLMRGFDGKRLLLCLYESREVAAQALQILKSAGFSEETIKIKNWEHGTELYKGRGTTMLETIITGAVGGAALGIVAGLLAAIGITQIPQFGLEEAAPAILLLAMLGLIAGGIFVGGMIGLFLGWGITSEDRFIYDDTIQHGEILMEMVVDIPRASTAWHIMRQVAVEARAQRVGELRG